MGFNRTSTICNKEILQVNKNADKKEKSVTIIEVSVEKVRIAQETKRVKAFRQIFDGLLNRQMKRQQIKFEELKKSYESDRKSEWLKMLLLLLPVLWLLLAFIRSSLCHAYNQRCQTFLHETIISTVFGCFVSYHHEEYLT